MTYQEFEFYEKTFDDYILKLKRKSEVRIHYYILRTKDMDYDYSFIGYLTNGGRHGLHYNRTKNTYYFGHRNPMTGSTIITLNPSQEMKIPSRLKDGLLLVANNKSGTIVKKLKR